MRARRALPRRRRAGILALALAPLLLVLGACSPAGDASDSVDIDTSNLFVEYDYPTIEVVENVTYGEADDGTALLLDVCLPETADDASTADLKPRAAIVSIHGGSWARGDKANAHWRNVCQWLASEGYVTVSVNYRLAPASVFPSQIEDVRQAVTWLRETSQVERFAIDPDVIGAFGGSAGGNLAALLGTEGEGDLTVGSRVIAVAELSGPVDLTEEGRQLGGLTDSFEQIQLDYLGCRSLATCARATTASPLYDVDATDPSFFIGHSTNELIPLGQSEAFVSKLRGAGVPTEFVTIDGPLHSIALLNDEMRARIINFYATELITEPTGVVP